MKLELLIKQAHLDLQAGRRWGDKEPLIRAAQLPPDPSEVEDVIRGLVQFYQAHARQHGFPYPPSQERLSEVLVQLAEADLALPLKTGQRVGLSFLKSCFPSYWDALTVPAWQNEHLMAGVLRYRLGLNGRGETFDISLAEVRRGFQVQRHALSFFSPFVAAQVYRRHLPEKKQAVVWDPSGGFGARMLGLAAVRPGSHYFAHEPASATLRDLRALACQLPLHADLWQSGSEFAQTNKEIPEGEVDLVFTSPPYFDLEKYFDEPGQCWRDYPSLPLWVDKYLVPTLEAARSGLCQQGCLVLNVHDPLVDEVKKAAYKVGFCQLATYSMKLRADHYARGRGQKERSEPFLVFGSLRKARSNMQSTSDVFDPSPLWDGIYDPRIEKEVWVEIVPQRYRVSNLGRLASATMGPWRLLKPTLTQSGYLSVGVTALAGKATKTHLVHQLVVRAFDGEAPTHNHTDVRHLNGDKTDNRLSNLAWGTRSENMCDVIKHKQDALRGLAQTSEQPEKRWEWYEGYTADEYLVSIGLTFLAEGKLSIADLSRLWKCSRAVAENIVHGETRKQILRVHTPDKQKRRTAARKKEILALVALGKNAAQINEELSEDLTPQAIYYYKSRLGL